MQRGRGIIMSEWGLRDTGSRAENGDILHILEKDGQCVRGGLDEPRRICGLYRRVRYTDEPRHKI